MENIYGGNPCTRECHDRSESCHATCEKYIEWNRYVTEKRESRYMARRSGQELDDVSFKRAIKTKKRMNRK